MFHTTDRWNEKVENKIIVALDIIENRDELLTFAGMLAPYVGGFKVGVTVDYFGVNIITALRNFDRIVISDPKICDIPLTTMLRVRAHADAGASFITVHACGGVAMLEAAASVAPKRIAAVTLLSSFDTVTARTSFGCASVPRKIRQFASLAIESGVDCIVCAPRDLRALAALPNDVCMKKMTPGVRPSWYRAPDDQNMRRTMTPRDALASGADYIIIGRPITRAKNPVEAILRIQEEIA